MTDKELLTKTAKVYGLEDHGWDRVTDGFRELKVHGVPHCGFTGPVWNPLNDDGDALRLAVKLNIGIRSHGADHWQQPNTSVALYNIGKYGGGRVTVPHGDDPAVAARRAIVRAAVAMADAGE